MCNIEINDNGNEKELTRKKKTDKENQFVHYAFRSLYIHSIYLNKYMYFSYAVV